MLVNEAFFNLPIDDGASAYAAARCFADDAKILACVFEPTAAGEPFHVIFEAPVDSRDSIVARLRSVFGEGMADTKLLWWDKKEYRGFGRSPMPKSEGKS